jgi:dienelactone hydrolase
LPAFIWNQGGLGKADAHLITHYGAKRGYVAMCIDFPMPGYRSTGGYNIVAGLDDQPNAFDSTISRGVVALLRAVTYLQTRPEVDKEKIGMCGSSWGGFYTTLMVGIDPRLKVGSAMFGCGFLETGNNWWGVAGTPTWHGPADTKHWAGNARPRPAPGEREDADRLVHRHQRHVLFYGLADAELRNRGGAKAPHASAELCARAEPEDG